MHGDGELPPLPVRWGQPRAGLVAHYRMSNDYTEAISITIDFGRARWVLAAVHEIGHFLDHRGVSPADDRASRRHPQLADWRRAIHASETWRALVRSSGSDENLMSSEECWVRSYAQWIAERSRDPILTRQLAASRGTDRNHALYHQQWDEPDFEPIGDAIDRLFRSLGRLS